MWLEPKGVLFQLKAAASEVILRPLLLVIKINLNLFSNQVVLRNDEMLFAMAIVWFASSRCGLIQVSCCKRAQAKISTKIKSAALAETKKLPAVRPVPAAETFAHIAPVYARKELRPEARLAWTRRRQGQWRLCLYCFAMAYLLNGDSCYFWWMPIYFRCSCLNLNLNWNIIFLLFGCIPVFLRLVPGHP